MPTVLYVDDESALRRVLHAWLEPRGVSVQSARSIAAAKACFEEHRFDGVFIDLWLSDGSGFELYDWLGDHYPELLDRVAFITGDILPTDATRRQFQLLGRPILAKPFDLDDIDRFVDLWTTAAAGEQRGETRS
jgi:CheY-like chemotaxis protein